MESLCVNGMRLSVSGPVDALPKNRDDMSPFENVTMATDLLIDHAPIPSCSTELSI